MVEISGMNKDPAAIEKKMKDLLFPKGYELTKVIGRDFIFVQPSAIGSQWKRVIFHEAGQRTDHVY